MKGWEHNKTIRKGIRTDSGEREIARGEKCNREMQQLEKVQEQNYMHINFLVEANWKNR